MTKNVCHTIVLDDLDGPIIRSQSIDVLKAVAGASDLNIYLLWFCRLDRFWRFRKQLRELRQELNDAGVVLLIIPTVIFKDPVSSLFLPFVMLELFLGLGWTRLRYNIDLFHSRSYLAGLASAMIYKVSKTKTIFDPRSPYPEENVSAGYWQSSSFSFRLWKRLEKWIIQHSAATIATNDVFAGELTSTVPAATVAVIPNNVSWVSKPRHEMDNAGPTALGDKITFCYLGSLGLWNKTEVYTDFLRRVKGMDFESIFVVPDLYFEKVRSSLQKPEMAVINASVVSVPPEDVQQLISTCTVGLQLMDQPDVRLSIKVVEYLAAGLPVIVSENISGAAALIKQREVGFVLKADYSNLNEAIDFIQKVNLDRDAWRYRCQKLAYDMFSTTVVANQVRALYQETLASGQ